MKLSFSIFIVNICPLVLWGPQGTVAETGTKGREAKEGTKVNSSVLAVSVGGKGKGGERMKNEWMT